MFRDFYEWICGSEWTGSCTMSNNSCDNYASYYLSFRYYGHVADSQYDSQTRVSSSLATVGRCLTCIGQYACLCFNIPPWCSTLAVSEYDEKLCQLCLVIHGALCHHKKYIFQWLSMISKRWKISSGYHKSNIDCWYTYPSKSVYCRRIGGRLYHSYVCGRMTSPQCFEKYHDRRPKDSCGK